MNVPASPTRIYEACFVEMGKALRTAQFYPLTHPAFQRSLERSYLYLSQLLKRVGTLEVTITKTGLSVHDRPVTGNTNVLSFLASELFRRRVKILHFDQNAELKDYQALFVLLAMEPHDVPGQGGPERVLTKAGAHRVWANAMRFEATQLAEPDPETLEEDEAGATAEAEQAVSIEEILADASPQHAELHAKLQSLAAARRGSEFKSLLAEIVQYAREHSAKGDHVPASLVLQVLARLAQQLGNGETVERMITPAVRAVATSEVVQVEIGRVSRTLGHAWEQHARALKLVGPAVIPYLLATVAQSDSRKERTRLIATLHMFGGELKKPALKLLGDTRWFVVRNAIDLLADCGDPEMFAHIRPFFKHEHARVRLSAREAARKLGGDAAMAALLEATERDEEVDRRHAVEQLTFFPAQTVLPKLVELIDKGSVAVADEALRVLSDLDPPDMLQFLEKTLGERPGLFNKRKKETLRRTAAELTFVRLPESWELLRRFAADGDEEIRKWVARAVEWMQKSRRRDEFVA